MGERVELFDEGQIVVDLRHRHLVVRALDGLGVRVLATEPEERLDLALLTLDGTAPGELDQLLASLYAHFLARDGRWVPTFGKNRDLESVEGLPHLGGGEGDPERVDGVPLAEPRGAGAGVRVGVLDTRLLPVDALDGRYISDGRPSATPPYAPWAGHAAFVAGLVLRRAPAAELHVRGVLDSGTGRASSWDVAKRMAEFLGNPVDVLNLSFGCFTRDGQVPFVLARAIERLAARTVLVAAAGNHGRAVEQPQADPPDTARTVPASPSAPMYPAAHPDVVAVGARDGATGERASFSPPDAAWVELAAPGVGVESTFVTGEVSVDGGTAAFDGWARWSGTSFAAAGATGEVAALVGETGSARRAVAAIRARDADDPACDVRPVAR